MMSLYLDHYFRDFRENVSNDHFEGKKKCVREDQVSKRLTKFKSVVSQLLLSSVICLETNLQSFTINAKHLGNFMPIILSNI